MINATFVGYASTGEVFYNYVPLDLQKSMRVRQHSPTGFAWGYGGSGPSQLALAILLEFLPEWQACHYYVKFKNEVIAGIKADEDFEMPASMVLEWIEKNVKPEG